MQGRIEGLRARCRKSVALPVFLRTYGKRAHVPRMLQALIDANFGRRPGVDKRRFLQGVYDVYRAHAPPFDYATSFVSLGFDKFSELGKDDILACLRPKQFATQAILAMYFQSLCIRAAALGKTYAPLNGFLEFGNVLQNEPFAKRLFKRMRTKNIKLIGFPNLNSNHFVFVEISMNQLKGIADLNMRADIRVCFNVKDSLQNCDETSLKADPEFYWKHLKRFFERQAKFLNASNTVTFDFTFNAKCFEQHDGAQCGFLTCINAYCHVWDIVLDRNERTTTEQVEAIRAEVGFAGMQVTVVEPKGFIGAPPKPAMLDVQLFGFNARKRIARSDAEMAYIFITEFWLGLNSTDELTRKARRLNDRILRNKTKVDESTLRLDAPVLAATQ
jgi:hypothetical protein